MVGLAERIYRAALRLLPSTFRARHREELLAVFRGRVGEAAAAGRPLGAGLRALRETVDLLATALRLRWRGAGHGRPDTAAGASSVPGAGASAPHPRRPRSGGSGRLGPFTGLPGDLRHAGRALLFRPGFALTAILTLALGIGSATAIFTVVDAVLLRPLPYPDPDRVVRVWRTLDEYGMDRGPLSYPDFLDLREGTRSFAAMSTYAWSAATLLGEGEPERVPGATFEGRMFELLGVPMALGRPLQPEDDVPGAEPVVVLSYGLWQRRFGGDPAVLGRTLELAGSRPRIVGVAPEGFDFPVPRAEFWTPLRMDPQTAERDANFLQVVARLRPDVPLETAGTDLRATLARIQEAHPGANQTDDIWLETHQDYLAGDIRPALLVIVGAVALLLALACANLVNLLLVRASARRHELGVRAALGAGAGRLRRVVLAESLLLAAAGGALGVAGAWAAVRLLLSLEAGILPRPGDVALEGRVLLFSLALSAACAVACGWLPAWGAARRAPAAALRSGQRAGTGRGNARVQGALVVAQVGLAAVLLVSAGLLGRSFSRLTSVPLGFRPEGVLTGVVTLPPGPYHQPGRADVFWDDVLERVGRLPGVTAAGAAWALPFSGLFASSTYAPEGAPEGSGSTVYLSPVRGDYFEAMGMTLVRGRGLGPADDAGAPEVAVVNETLARRFWPGQDPIGKRFAGDGPGGDDVLTVVGVVADVKGRTLDEEAVPQAFLPHRQAAWDWSLFLAVRTDGPPAALAPALRREVRAVDPTLPVAQVMPLTARISDSVALPRLRTLVIAAFATAAALIALVGIYAVLSFVVAERERELAVRMALGAARERVLGQVLRRGVGLAGLGLGLGLLGGVAATRVLRGFLFGVEPLDLVTFGGTALLLLATAAAASWVPARRAAGVDPMRALRGQ